LTICTVTVKSLNQTLLSELLDSILPKKLKISTKKVMIEYNDKILFERDDEFSEEEHFVKKLGTSLAGLNLTQDSIMFI
jgi:hypothetical protein